MKEKKHKTIKVEVCNAICSVLHHLKSTNVRLDIRASVLSDTYFVHKNIVCLCTIQLVTSFTTLTKTYVMNTTSFM